GGYFAERWSKGSSMPPLGLLYIGAVLEKDGVPVEIVPADVLGMSWADVRRKIQADKPDIVGVTVTTENRFQSFRLIRLAKKACPEALTVLGGPHASMAAEDCLEHIPELDFVVRGEGEETMREVCRVFRKGAGADVLDGVRGVVFRKDGRVAANPPRPPITDLDSLPYPAFHLVPFEKYNFTFEVPGRGSLPAVNVMTSRGCPFNCNFCATPINWGRHVRMRSPENVIREIELLKERYGIKVVFFYDDTFNASPKRADALCDLMISRRLDVYFKCDVRVDIMSRALLEKMKQAGLFHLSYGLEAGSDRVRERIVGKQIDMADFRNLTDWCVELGVIANVFFIFSHPTETWEEARETINQIEQYRGRIEGSVAILHIYPGTPLEKISREQGVLPEGFTWTKRHRRGIITLPLAQGDVPLYLDKLTWAQVSELVLRWSFSSGRSSLHRKASKALKSIRTFGDLKRLVIMGWVFLKLKYSRHQH
ncbi:MAG: B12-binding domain-containing radical SAM protein, partial [Candidatus Aminicenantes bacterium]|nr:B12-binding domain-containing radical SAM protein [Candidatus Aminicenantes bacterium]